MVARMNQRERDIALRYSHATPTNMNGCTFLLYVYATTV